MNDMYTYAELKQEAISQSKLFDSLKNWLKIALNITTFSLVLTLFGNNLHPAVSVIGWITLTISILAALIIGYALRRGRDNLNTIFQLLDKMKATH